MTAIDPQLLEQLSAWMDGELPADESRFLQRRLANDVALREQWERWQLASACLQRMPVRAMDTDLADRVAGAIATAANDAPPNAARTRFGWLASAAALAVAAVMLPGILAVDPGRPSAPGPAASVALAPVPPALSPAPDATVDAVPPMSPLPSVRDFPLVMRAGQAWPRSPLPADPRLRDGWMVGGPHWVAPAYVAPASAPRSSEDGAARAADRPADE